MCTRENYEQEKSEIVTYNVQKYLPLTRKTTRNNEQLSAKTITKNYTPRPKTRQWRMDLSSHLQNKEPRALYVFAWLKKIQLKPAHLQFYNFKNKLNK